MPHLMNCAHSAEGWCLDCVGDLHERCEGFREGAAAFQRAMAEIARLRDENATLRMEAEQLRAGIKAVAETLPVPEARELGTVPLPGGGVVRLDGPWRMPR